MPQPSPERTILGYQAAVQQVRSRVERYALTIWGSLGSYREADIDRMVSLVLPAALAGQRQVAGLTDTYLASLLGRTARAGVDPALVSGAALRGGVDPAEVYRRPGSTIYIALAKGDALDVAVAKGRRRLLSVVGTDLQLAKRLQQDHSMGQVGVTRYRRVLTGTEHCALCPIAARQVYNVGTLLPIHPGCNCDVAPESVASVAAVLNDQKPSASAEAELVSRGIATEPTVDLLAVHEHGEYGPTLAWAGDHFTGPGDLAA